MQNKSKEQYEEEIHALVRQYSEVSGDGMDILKKTMFYRLMNVAAEYVFSRHIIIKNKEEYGEEIFKTIKNCIASFNFDKGDNFVHYLKAGIKQNLKKSKTENRRFDTSGGVHISTKTIHKIKKTLYQKQLFTMSGKNANYEEMVHWIGKNLGLDPKTVKNYLDKSILLNVPGEYDFYQDEADEKHNAMPAYINFTSQSSEEAYIHTESLIELLDIFNEVFNKTQERVKPYLRQLLSAKYFEAAVEAQKLNKNYPFFDYKTIKTRAIGQNISTQKEIAEKWRRDESDASRTIEKFEKRVKEKIPARQTVRR